MRAEAWRQKQSVSCKRAMTPERVEFYRGLGRKRWLGKLSCGRHCHPLVKRLFRIMNREQSTMTEVAERAGLQRATISDWRYIKNPSLPNFDAALRSMGYRLVIKQIDGELEPDGFPDASYARGVDSGNPPNLVMASDTTQR